MKLDTEKTFFRGLGDLVCFAWIAEGVKAAGGSMSFFATDWRAEVLRFLQQEVTDDRSDCFTVQKSFAEGLEEGTKLDYLGWINSQISPETLPLRPKADFIPMDRHLGREMGRDVLIFPQCTDASRTWPASYYLELACQLHTLGVKVAIVIQKDDGTFHGSPVQVIAGQPLARIAAAMQVSKLVIGNDSGPAHLAATLATKTLVVQGSTTGRIYSYLPEVLAMRAEALPCSGCHGNASFWRPACNVGCQELYRLSPFDVLLEALAQLGVKSLTTGRKKK